MRTFLQKPKPEAFRLPTRPVGDGQRAATAGPERLRSAGASNYALATQATSGLVVQRACACGGPCTNCSGDSHDDEALVQRKTAHSQGTAGALAPQNVHRVIQRPGRPLDSETRRGMETRLGHDFGRVRIHSGAEAAQSAASIGAHAYTVGRHVVMGQQTASPGVLAHELTHTIHQRQRDIPPGTALRIGPEMDVFEREANAAASATHSGRRQNADLRVQRLTFQGDCTLPQSTTSPSVDEGPAAEGGAAEPVVRPDGTAALQQAWNRATTLNRDVIERLGTVRRAMRLEGGPDRLMPREATLLRKTFGDIGGLEGVQPGGGGMFTRIGTLIDRFRQIQDALDAGNYTIECRPPTDSECGSYLGAYVRDDVQDTIFICRELFFSQDLDRRAETIIHELAHAELGIAHAGSGGRTEDVQLPSMVYDCENGEGFGLDFRTAIRNAYVYDTLVACLVGSQPSSRVEADVESGGTEHTDAEHAANELGAFLLIPATGDLPGAEVRYIRMLGGHAPGFQAYGGVGASYLPHGDTLGLGLGAGARYTTTFNLFTQLGAGLEGSLEMSPSGGGGPVPHAGAFGELEVGVHFGMFSLSGGYRLIVPFEEDAFDHLHHLFTAGAGFHF